MRETFVNALHGSVLVALAIDHQYLLGQLFAAAPGVVA